MNKELVTLVAKDFYTVASALNDIYPELITDTMDMLRVKVFELEPRCGRKYLDYDFKDIKPALDDLKKNINLVPDDPYYRSALARLKLLYRINYNYVSEVYKGKMAAENTAFGFTQDEMRNAFEVLKRSGLF